MFWEKISEKGQQKGIHRERFLMPYFPICVIEISSGHPLHRDLRINVLQIVRYMDTMAVRSVWNSAEGRLNSGCSRNGRKSSKEEHEVRRCSPKGTWREATKRKILVEWRKGNNSFEEGNFDGIKAAMKGSALSGG